MGDRGNIGIYQEDDAVTIYFYTHWKGYAVADILAEALEKRERWDDDAYLARIIFDTLTAGDTGTTGYGISTSISDNSYPIPVVYCRTQEVSYKGVRYTFQSFIDARKAGLL